MKSIKGLFVAAMITTLFGLSFRPTRAFGDNVACYSEAVGVTSQSSNLCGAVASELGVSPTYIGAKTWVQSQGQSQADISMGVNHLYLNTIETTNDKTGAADGIWSRADGYSAWQDYITITSASLSRGTPVTIQITFNLDAIAIIGGWAGYSESVLLGIPGAHSSPSSMPAGWNNPYDVYANYPPAFPEFGVTNVAYESTSAPSGGEFPNRPSTSLTIDSQGEVGGTYWIGADLYGNVLAKINYAPDGGTGSAILDASDTALYGINILNPGASYTSQSGFVYPTNVIPTSSVPEPSTFLLLCLGLAALSVWGVKSRRAWTA